LIKKEREVSPAKIAIDENDLVTEKGETYT